MRVALTSSYYSPQFSPTLSSSIPYSSANPITWLSSLACFCLFSTSNSDDSSIMIMSLTSCLIFFLSMSLDSSIGASTPSACNFYISSTFFRSSLVMATWFEDTTVCSCGSDGFGGSSSIESSMSSICRISGECLINCTNCFSRSYASRTSYFNSLFSLCSC